jgi:transposase InsO family protein
VTAETKIQNDPSTKADKLEASNTNEPGPEVKSVKSVSIVSPTTEPTQLSNKKMERIVSRHWHDPYDKRRVPAAAQPPAKRKASNLIGFKLLYGFVIVRLSRRDLVWINVTTNPTAEWIARQITEAFPWNEGPRYLVRDRDRIYGAVVTRRLRAMGIRDKPTAPASPWQNGFAERLIGSIRRECLDHIIVLGEEHLRRILKNYAAYYNGVRTHRSLNKDAPISRPVQRSGVISSHAVLGGLHHHYVRI